MGCQQIKRNIIINLVNIDTICSSHPNVILEFPLRKKKNECINTEISLSDFVLKFCKRRKIFYTNIDGEDEDKYGLFPFINRKKCEGGLHVGLLNQI